MDSGHDVDVPAFKAFVSEEELDKKRQERQEEWDKVRKPDDPEEAPEEPYDGRSLFDRLQEQKVKKQEDFEDQFRLINQVKGLDEDEAVFLDQVSERQDQLIKERHSEDSQVLEEFQQTLLQKTLQQKLPTKNTLVAQVRHPTKAETSSKKKNSQASLLQKAIKRKCADMDTERNSSNSEAKRLDVKLENLDEVKTKGNILTDMQKENPVLSTKTSNNTILTTGNRLPGIAVYSDSDISSSETGDEES